MQQASPIDIDIPAGDNVMLLLTLLCIGWQIHFDAHMSCCCSHFCVLDGNVAVAVLSYLTCTRTHYLHTYIITCV